MKRLLCAVALIANSVSAGSVVMANHAALATASPYATQVGLDVLKRGGNAIDASVAVAFALAAAHPQSGNIGGGGFLIYYDAATRAVWTLDFREVAPAAATRDMFASGRSSSDGALAVAVPGTVAGLEAMHERFGTQPWKELVAPAIRLARDGVRISGDLATDAARAQRERNINAVPAGETQLVQNDLAETLERIARKGARDFYDGEIAARIVDGVRQAGGIVSLRDLRDYRPIWRSPIRISYREFDLYTVPAPSAAGLVIGQELNILSGYNLAASGYQSAACIHLLAEAARRAAIDRDRYLGDPANSRVSYRDLLSPQRAAQWRSSIHATQATPTITLTQPATTVAHSLHTTHFTIADSSGNIAAITTSLGDKFGSGLVVPHCGFFLNNAMHDFSVGEPSGNPIAPGNRMTTSVAPTIILRRGQPYLALGTSGGAAIPNIVLQIFLGVATFGKPLAEAVDAPRYDQQATPEDISCESGRSPAATVSQLRAMGHGVREREPFGDVHALLFETQRITAVSDARHGGAAGGF